MQQGSNESWFGLNENRCRLHEYVSNKSSTSSPDQRESIPQDFQWPLELSSRNRFQLLYPFPDHSDCYFQYCLVVTAEQYLVLAAEKNSVRIMEGHVYPLEEVFVHSITRQTVVDD